MVSAVIVAAGKGTRMGGPTDKLFMDLAGLPVVGHTWRRFDTSPDIDEIILVVREGREPEFEQLAERLDLSKPWKLARGGRERQHSVWNGIQAVSSNCDIVAIQDGARPCTDADTIQEILRAAGETGAAVAASLISDTVKETLDGQTISRHLDRGQLRAVQTPQAFRLSVIRKALEKVMEEGLNITDDTAACALIGQPVRLVIGKSPNPKVTHPEDLPFIAGLLKKDTV